MKNSLLSIILVLTFIVSSAWAGTDGQIRGNVVSIEGEALIGAQVYIEELGIGAVADLNGNYILLNIPVGTYDITVTMISYRTQIVSDVEVMVLMHWAGSLGRAHHAAVPRD